MPKHLEEWKNRFEETHQSLKKESRTLRFARAFDEKMSMESVAELVQGMLEDEETGQNARVRLLKLVLDNAKDADAKSAEHDLASLEIDDLHAALFSSALELLMQDEEFCLSVLYEVFQNNSNLWDRLQENPPDAKRIEVKVTDG